MWWCKRGQTGLIDLVLLLLLHTTVWCTTSLSNNVVVSKRQATTASKLRPQKHKRSGEGVKPTAFIINCFVKNYACVCNKCARPGLQLVLATDRPAAGSLRRCCFCPKRVGPDGARAAVMNDEYKTH
jgi:hypothetical protein